MAEHKLSAITDPQFVVELPDGTKKTYDLYELLEKMQQTDPKVVEEEGNFAANFKAIKSAFGIDSLTRGQAFALQGDVVAEMQELPEQKKMRALT